ncbi:hypothetical protein [Kiloniella sp. b19]|uniref:hypothetical protein n=1 Tax=Kiloniella sp. GXU_MW_B19 TaxID=3141326 RepID=UPI0031D50438
MDIRFVTKNLHAYLDYPVALALMGLPTLLNLGSSHPLAFWVSTITGCAALLLTIFTDHHLGLIRVLPYRLHLAVDLSVGLVFALVPFIFGFSGLDAWYYWLNGGAVLFVVGLHKPEVSAISAAHS